MAEFVLVHAPVLGPGSWALVADELTRLGHRVSVPSLTAFTDDGPPYALALLQRARTQLPADAGDRVVLVVHSGAGELAPYLADMITARDVAVVFADASLPPTSGDARVIDSAFLPFLRDLATGGMVPPWPQWWPEDVLTPLFPDDVTRRSVTGEARPLPLAFFEEHLPPAPGSWPSCHRGYLRFSDGYQDQARDARRRGWPVRELPGEHLHMLVDPIGVATAIAGLAIGAAT